MNGLTLAHQNDRVGSLSPPGSRQTQSQANGLHTNAPDCDDLFTTINLPSPALDENWLGIFLPEGIKQKLLRRLDLLDLLAKNYVVRDKLDVRGTFLFYGQPGCGKTSLGRGLPNEWTALRGEPGILVEVNTHAAPSGQRGGTQKNVLRLFRGLAEIASIGRPVFILIDEIETLATNRARVNADTNPVDTAHAVNAFIQQHDLFVREWSNAVFLLSTNLFRDIDPALAGRCDVQIEIPPPAKKQRLEILRDALSNLNGIVQVDIDASSTQIEKLLDQTDGLSARELRHLVHEAIIDKPLSMPLRIEQLIHAAQEIARRRDRQHETGGVYIDA